MTLLAPTTPDWEVTADYARVVVMSDSAWLGFDGISLTGSRRVHALLEARVTARWLVHPWLVPWTAFEGSTSLHVSPALGRWHPSWGLQLGASGAMNLDWPEIYGEGWREGPAVDSLDGLWLWLGFSARPARFFVGRLSLSVAEVSVGTMDFGRAVRFQLTPAAVGYAW